MNKYTYADAMISDCGKYRYWLKRQWLLGNADDKEWCCWIMLNPSTADGSMDDPTIRRCVSFTNREGYQNMIVVNLFALRATDPSEIPKATDAVGPQNPQTLGMALVTAKLVIAAWGGKFPTRTITLAKGITGTGRKIYCLGKNKDGSPKHPLYVKYSQPLVLL